MEITKIKLSDHYDVKTNAYVEIIRPTEMLDRGEITSFPALIICPGGGYGMVSKREGEPVALEFLARGYVTMILTYSTLSTEENSAYPMQIEELMSAIDYLTKNAERYSVDPERMFLIGFSAGGHLVCNLGAHYHRYLDRYKINIKGICLSYPVIASELGTSGNTYKNLLRGYEGEEKERLLEDLSFNRADLTRFPPAFVWTTSTDDLVPALNSVSLVENLLKHGRRCEFHLFPKGPHGLSTGAALINSPLPELKQISTWVDLCNQFFMSL
jgi:acetyl esterase/lipase